MQPDRQHLASIMHRTYSIDKPHIIITTPDKLVNRNLIIKHEIQNLEAYTTFPPRMNQHHKMPAMKILLLIHDGNERKQKAKYQKVQEVNVLDFLISQNNQLTYNNKDYIIEQIKTIYEKLIIENLENSKQLQNYQEILVSENKQIQQSLIQVQGKIKQISKQVIQYFQLQQEKQANIDMNLCQLQKKTIQNKNLSKNIYKQPNKFQQVNKNERRNRNGKKDTNKQLNHSTADNNNIKKKQQKLEDIKCFLKQNYQFLQGNIQTKQYVQLFWVFIEKGMVSQHKNKIKSWQNNLVQFKKQFYHIEKCMQNIQQLTQLRKSLNNVQIKVSSQEFINALKFLNKKIQKINQKMLKTLKDLINRVENIKDDMNNKLKIIDNLEYEGNQYFENIVYFLDYFKLRDQLKNKLKQSEWNKQNLEAITLVYSLNHNIQQCQNRLKFFQEVFGIVFGGHYKNLFKKRNTIYYKSSFEHFKESNTSDEQSSLSSDNIDDEEQSELNLCEKKVKRHILPKTNIIFRILNKKQNKISYKEVKNNQIINQYNSETQEEEDLNFFIWQSPLYKQQA